MLDQISSFPSASLTEGENSFPPGVAWIDGRFVSMAEARIPVLDWGFLRSDATYDVVHVWKGRFFRLDAHIERFQNSVRKLRMRLPGQRLEHILHACVARPGCKMPTWRRYARGHSPSFSLTRVKPSIALSLSPFLRLDR